LEKRAFPSVLQVSNVVSLDPVRSLVDDTVVNDERLDDEGMDGSFSLHRGPSSCCSIALHLQYTQHVPRSTNENTQMSTGEETADQNTSRNCATTVCFTLSLESTS